MMGVLWTQQDHVQCVFQRGLAWRRLFNDTYQLQK